jgi:hypothetical protein
MIIGPEPSERELVRMRETARFYLACQKMHLGQVTTGSSLLS